MFSGKRGKFAPGCHKCPREMCCVAALAAALYFAVAGITASAAGAPDESAMIFLPPGAAYCRQLSRLEPMQKYDAGTTRIGEGEAQSYFVYRGIEEWLRGFLTAVNKFRTQSGSGDVTHGTDVYQLMPRLFEYCRSHPDELISDAAVHFLAVDPSAK